MDKKIVFLKHREIDFQKWDNAIENSYNGLVYAYSFFLDAMSNESWDALVLGNYEAVFPLVWKKKLGIKYLYQPYFCQQLGLFSKNKISKQILEYFIDAIPSQFRFWDLHLNTENVFYRHNISFKSRTTFQIGLMQDYLTIYDNYNSDAKKNIAKTTLNGFVVKTTDSPQLAIDTFFETYGQHYPKHNTLKKQLLKCTNSALKLQKGFLRSIYGTNGELWSIGFFFISNSKIHYALAAPTESGKKQAATHILIDEVLKEFSNQNIIFDFEGSDIQSVAYFYSKFGSAPIYYTQIRNNKLPFWCRFLKK